MCGNSHLIAIKRKCCIILIQRRGGGGGGTHRQENRFLLLKEDKLKQTRKSWLNLLGKECVNREEGNIDIFSSNYLLKENV